MDSDIFPVIFLEKVQFFQIFQKISDGVCVCPPPPPPLAEAIQKAEGLEAHQGPQDGQGLHGFEGFEEIEAFCGHTFLVANLGPLGAPVLLLDATRTRDLF